MYHFSNSSNKVELESVILIYSFFTLIQQEKNVGSSADPYVP